MTARSDSGSSCSPSAVEPVTSQNRTRHRLALLSAPARPHSERRRRRHRNGLLPDSHDRNSHNGTRAESTQAPVPSNARPERRTATPRSPPTARAVAAVRQFPAYRLAGRRIGSVVSTAMRKGTMSRIAEVAGVAGEEQHAARAHTRPSSGSARAGLVAVLLGSALVAWIVSCSGCAAWTRDPAPILALWAGTSAAG